MQALFCTSPAVPTCAAFYFVFEEVVDAAEFALELSDLVTNTAWDLRGLPSNLNIRISLHAAPVFKVVDPGACRA